MHADVDAAEYDYREQQNYQDAADETEFLAADGENEIRMLVGEHVRLRQHSLHVASPRKPARGYGGTALAHLPGHAETLGVHELRTVGSDYPGALVFAEHVFPYERSKGRAGGDAGEKPYRPDAAGEEHRGEYHQEDQRGAEIGAGIDYQQEHEGKVRQQRQQRREVGYAPLGAAQRGHVLCQQQHEAGLYDLRGLYAYPGKAQPAAVAGAALHAPEHQRARHEQLEDDEQIPPVREGLAVEQGEEQEQAKPYQYRGKLHDGIRAAVIARRGADDQHQPVKRTDEAYYQQQHVGRAQIRADVLQGVHDL